VNNFHSGGGAAALAVGVGPIAEAGAAVAAVGVEEGGEDVEAADCAGRLQSRHVPTAQ